MSKSQEEDLSHFHDACRANNVELIRQLLAESKEPIDVNRPVDPSPRGFWTARESPLHLALKPLYYYSENDDNDARLATVDFLLKNGAQVNVKDVKGNTPLHYAAKLRTMEKKFDILKKILEAGADVNAYGTGRDVEPGGPGTGATAFYLLLLEGHYSDEILELFIKRGSRFNAYNPLFEYGYVAAAFARIERKNMLLKAMRDHPHTIEPDEQGRTVFHSLVAHPGKSSGSELDVEEYVELIDELATISGCDVNDQDKKGRIPLRLAADYGNREAIEALLIAGIDINITDNDGKVTFEYPNGHRSYTFPTIAEQVRKLELLGLDVSQKNREVARSVRVDNRYLGEMMPQKIQKDLELTKSVQVVLPSLTLRHFLYEISPKATAAIIGNDAAIREFFQNFEDWRFEELRTLFKLQYKKAVARTKLIEPAAVALDVISGCSVLCAEMVVRFLKNSDLKRLIEASTFLR